MLRTSPARRVAGIFMSAALLATVLAARSASPQQPSPVTGWQPLRPVVGDPRIPASAWADARRQAEAVIAVLKAVPVGQRLDLEIRPELRMQWEESGPYSATLTLQLYPSTPNAVDQVGRPRRAIENAIERSANTSNVLCSGSCSSPFREPQAAPPLAGFGVYRVVRNEEHQVLILAVRKAPFYLPVMQEEMVQARVRDFRGRLDKFDAEVRARRAAPSKLGAWLRERPQRRKEQEALLLSLRAQGFTPEKINQMRADFEQGEKETEAMLRELEKEEPGLQSQENESLAQAREIVAPMESRLAGMSPAERSAPA
jgi:hypothetical protein